MDAPTRLDALADRAVGAGLATLGAANRARDAYRRGGGSPVGVLVRVAGVDDEAMAKLLADAVGAPLASAADVQSHEPSLGDRIPRELSASLGVLPLRLRPDGRLMVAVVDPSDGAGLEEASFYAGASIVLRVVSVSRFEELFARTHGASWLAEDGTLAAPPTSASRSIDEELSDLFDTRPLSQGASGSIEVVVVDADELDAPILELSPSKHGARRQMVTPGELFVAHELAEGEEVIDLVTPKNRSGSGARPVASAVSTGDSVTSPSLRAVRTDTAHSEDDEVIDLMPRDRITELESLEDSAVLEVIDLSSPAPPVSASETLDPDLTQERTAPAIDFDGLEFEGEGLAAPGGEVATIDRSPSDSDFPRGHRKRRGAVTPSTGIHRVVGATDSIEPTAFGPDGGAPPSARRRQLSSQELLGGDVLAIDALAAEFGPSEAATDAVFDLLRRGLPETRTRDEVARQVVDVLGLIYPTVMVLSAMRPRIQVWDATLSTGATAPIGSTFDANDESVWAVVSEARRAFVGPIPLSDPVRRSVPRALGDTSVVLPIAVRERVVGFLVVDAGSRDALAAPGPGFARTLSWVEAALVRVISLAKSNG